MTIGKKLAIGFAVVLILLVFVGVSSFYGITGMSKMPPMLSIKTD